jgi:type VI secretion system protein ImpL
VIENRLALVDQSREALRKVVRGSSAKERVYADIKARASTRFPIVTVSQIISEADKNVIYGGHAISGAFTRAAWTNYIQDAIKQAANQQLQSVDWVLKTAVQDDLTLEGSPEHIEKALLQMYKADFVAEWTKFMQSVTIGEFSNFNEAVVRMNRLGDPVDSPINALMTALYEQTSWDNPSLVNQQVEKTQGGIIRWFKDSILRQAPSPVEVRVDVNAAQAKIPMGPVGEAFAPIASLMTARNKGDTTLLKGYLERLSQIRAKFNQIKTAGDIGPPSKALMQDTLGGNRSELGDALRFVDESMLAGMSDSAKSSIRPLLVRPLIQAFAVLIEPTEEEINRTWVAQVHKPFTQSLELKYPFSPSARIEARPEEIAQFFGPEGAVAKFSESALGQLVQRRGDVISPRTWADIGVRLTPAFTANFARYVTPGGGRPDSGGMQGGGANPHQVFQLRPRPAPGLYEYSIDIDGQVLRYRNAAADWMEFHWPGAGQLGAKISGVNYSGETVEISNFPGYFGLERLINSAVRRRQPDGTFELSWTSGAHGVSVDLKIISSTQVDASSDGGSHGMQHLTLPSRVAGPDL